MRLRLLRACLLSVLPVIPGAAAQAGDGAARALETRRTPVVAVEAAAAQWGLSATEYRHYQQLMAAQRGLWSPGLDPLTALGVSTDSPEERRRFAELHVRSEYARTRKELAFQLAVNDAWQRLYPDTPRFQPVAATPPSAAPRTALVVRLGSEAGRALINERLPVLLQAPHAMTDVHVSGTDGDDSALRDWAASMPLLIDALRQGRVTLNHGEQFRTELALPQVYRRSGDGQWARVP